MVGDAVISEDNTGDLLLKVDIRVSDRAVRVHDLCRAASRSVLYAVTSDDFFSGIDAEVDIYHFHVAYHEEWGIQIVMVLDGGADGCAIRCAEDVIDAVAEYVIACLYERWRGSGMHFRQGTSSVGGFGYDVRLGFPEGKMWYENWK